MTKTLGCDSAKQLARTTSSEVALAESLTVGPVAEVVSAVQAVADDHPGEPLLVYDLQGIRGEMSALREDMASALGDRAHGRLYSVKANAHPTLLEHLGQHGIGASVASRFEWHGARAARMNPVHATAPGLGGPDLTAMVADGVKVDIDNLEQLQYMPAGSDIGVRIQMALPPGSCPREEGASRFGINRADPLLKRLIDAGGHRVTRIHCHERDVGEADDLRRLVSTVVATAKDWPDVQSVNLGGGMTRLYRLGLGREAWLSAAPALESLPSNVRVLVEPGAQAVTAHGYLVTHVVSAQRRLDGRQLAVLDTSRWQLVAWSDVSLIVAPGSREAVASTDLVGPTCYEGDTWQRDLPLPKLRVGDRLIFRGVGAYVSSMARRMHGIPLPREFLVDPSRHA